MSLFFLTLNNIASVSLLEHSQQGQDGRWAPGLRRSLIGATSGMVTGFNSRARRRCVLLAEMWILRYTGALAQVQYFRLGGNTGPVQDVPGR